LLARPDQPWGPPSLLNNGYQVYPRGKGTRAWLDHPPPSSAEVKGRVELYLYFVAYSRVNFTFTPLVLKC
jgi:hypothetical protein